MGGVAGHLSHLYDNRDLTFNEMKKILSLASNGDLIGTEKTDGYNIYLGFKNGEARYARNKGDMQVGGRSTDDLAARVFAGGESVKKVYNDSFRAFQKAVKSLTPVEQEAIFGPNGEIFYNTEIQGPGASNLVNYDANVLSIHHGGHKMYDATEDRVVDIDAEENSKALDKVIDRFEEATSDEPFSVRRTAFLKLKQLDGDYDLQITIAKIKKAGFDGNMTIEEYLENNLHAIFKQELPYFSEQIEQDVIDRVLRKTDESGQNAFKSLALIYKGFPTEQKQAIREFVNNGNKYIKQAILPIEEAIHDFAVELLKGMQSAYILDNEEEVSRIKAEVEEAIKQIQAYQGDYSGELQDILAQQLRKIKHIDNINTAVEGFVFQYGDQLYKFTGNFAPVNQLLGLFKYGRGAIPPIKKAEVQEQGGDDTPETISRRKIAVIPGKFKPPHRGHLDMVKHYAEIADVVVILISPISKVSDGGLEISRSESKQIWEVYLNSAGLDSSKVVIARSPFNSPVQSSYELVAGNIDGFRPAPGDLIIPGASTKPDPKSGHADTSRFRKFHMIPKEMRAPGVLAANVEDYAFTPSEVAGVAVSATNFRAALDAGDLESIISFIPDGVNPETILDIVQDESSMQKKTLTLESLYSLVESAFDQKLNEVYSQKQKNWACAQLGDDFKGEKELTKKQAKEMCSAEIQEQQQLEESLQKLKNAVAGISKVGSMMKSFVNFLKGDKTPEALVKMHKEMSEANPWYPDYLDPIKQQQEITDTLEILFDFKRRGLKPAVHKGKAGGERELDLDWYDYKLLDMWFRHKATNLLKSRKKENYLQKMIDIETGKTKVKGWDDPEYRMAALLEEDDEINETSGAGAGAVAGSPGMNRGPWPGLEKEKDREDLTIAHK